MGGGASEVILLQKEGWGGKSLSHAEGGRGITSFEVVLMWELEVLAIVMGGGGAKSFHPLKAGRRKLYPVLRGGGGAKSFDPQFFHFVAPLSP